MVRSDGRKRVTTLTRTRSRQLRRNMTGPERRLWSKLGGKQLRGVRFRSQFPIDPYIVDFYCAKAKLAIELDGDSHDGRLAQDTDRTEFLERLGIRLLRVSNDEVLTNLDGVIKAIARALGFSDAEATNDPALLKRPSCRAVEHESSVAATESHGPTGPAGTKTAGRSFRTSGRLSSVVSHVQVPPGKRDLRLGVRSHFVDHETNTTRHDATQSHGPHDRG